jgi:hypothetical protein
MRQRKLTRDEAIEEYLVYRLRLYDFLHITQVAIEIWWRGSQRLWMFVNR